MLSLAGPMKGCDDGSSRSQMSLLQILVYLDLHAPDVPAKRYEVFLAGQVCA